VLGLGTAALLLILTLAGVPQRIWADMVRRTAVAGFEIKRVEVTGAREMPKLSIYDAALSGTSNAILTADLPAIRERLRKLPWVADASVGRRLPDTLVIDIVERRPVALWQVRGHFSAIDITGKPLTDRGLERYRALPVVVGPGANARVRELLALTAAAPTLSDKVDAAILVGGRRWNLRFKSGETLALPDTPAAATAAFKRFASLEASLGADRKLLGGRFERFDMRLPGQMTVGGPAVQQALEAAARAAKSAPKPTTI
jgi:cell division protein FtsQ